MAGAQPSGIYTTQAAAEKALRRIGAYSINDTGADPEELRETLEWMDLAVAELAEIEECWWLVPETITQTLTANDGTYTLNLFANYPATGIAFPMAAYISDGTNDRPIEILRRREYEDKSNKATAGAPEAVYIDRLADNKNVKLYPVQNDSTSILKLVVQTFAPDVRGGEGNLVGNIDHNFPRAWQLWLILRTAALIGDGPVRNIGAQAVDRIEKQAAASLQALMSFQSREKPGQPRRTKPWGRA